MKISGRNLVRARNRDRGKRLSSLLSELTFCKVKLGKYVDTRFVNIESLYYLKTETRDPDAEMNFQEIYIAKDKENDYRRHV